MEFRMRRVEELDAVPEWLEQRMRLAAQKARHAAPVDGLWDAPEIWGKGDSFRAGESIGSK